MAKNKHITILMEKIVINYSTFAFKPINIIKGNYDEEDQVFVDEYENTYYSWTDASMIGFSTEETHCFSDYFTDSNLKKMYPDCTKNERLQQLLDDAIDHVWLGTISEENLEEIKIIQLPINDLEEVAMQQDMEIDADSFKLAFALSEETLNELLKTNDLKELKKMLSEIYEQYQEGKKQICSEMGIGSEHRIETKNPKPQTAEEISTNSSSKINPEIYKKINITDMYKYITERVIGQDEAVKQIITTFIMTKIETNPEEIIDKEVTRMFITGPTGSGKTLIIETMLEYLSKVHELHLPIATVPTSQLTASGYIGMDLEDILESLVKNTKGDFTSIKEKIEYAEKNGIVYLDELDKKGSTGNGDVSGRSVLNALLAFLTGSDYDIAISGDRKIHRTDIYKFNTKYLTIIASGAFTNVFDNSHTKLIGFGHYNTTEPKSKISPKEFATLGDMPKELIGRFHRIIHINPMTIQALKTIMTTSKNSALLATQAKLKVIGIGLEWEDSFIEKVAEKTLKSGFGARYLKSIIEESLQEIEWEALTQNTSSIIVTAETVDNPKQFIIKK